MDARSLLRAKREQAKVEHPYASYASGSLKCTICGTHVKDGAAWDGHLGSKAHRKNLARAKEEQRLKEEAALRPAKRHAQDADEDADEAHESKKRRVEPAPAAAASGFPANFFSDPSRALPANDDNDDEELPASAPAPAQASELDAEWEAFQRNVINADLAAESREESFARATIAAEPELAEELPQGFPAELAERRAAARAALQPPAEEQQQAPEETAAEKNRRKELEEKELIMDRLLEEERVQEEADNKVALLKVRYSHRRVLYGLCLMQTPRLASSSSNGNEQQNRRPNETRACVPIRGIALYRLYTNLHLLHLRLGDLFLRNAEHLAQDGHLPERPLTAKQRRRKLVLIPRVAHGDTYQTIVACDACQCPTMDARPDAGDAEQCQPRRRLYIQRRQEGVEALQSGCDSCGRCGRFVRERAAWLRQERFNDWVQTRIFEKTLVLRYCVSVV